MKNHFVKILASAVTMLAFAATVHADTINGGVSLGGNVTYNTGDINTATAFLSFTGVTIKSLSGSYISAGFTAGNGVTMNGFTFNPFGSSVVPLWTTTEGAATASFDLLSLTSRVQPGDDTLTLKGTGTLHLTGYQDTPGTWSFTSQGLGGTFSFSSSNAAVPDGGTTAILLGFALSALAFARKSLV